MYTLRKTHNGIPPTVKHLFFYNIAWPELFARMGFFLFFTAENVR